MLAAVPNAIEPDVLEKLRAANPGVELVQLEALGIGFVFKSPPRAEWKRFRAMYNNPAQQADAFEALVFGCLLHPTADDLRRALDRKPALAELFGAKLADAAGISAEVIEKK
jgi:hypothetical protein